MITEDSNIMFLSCREESELRMHPSNLWTCYTGLLIHFNLYAEMSNQELISAGNKTMDETDQAIERSKQVK